MALNNKLAYQHPIVLRNKSSALLIEDPRHSTIVVQDHEDPKILCPDLNRVPNKIQSYQH
jgi:hypothetical protein